MELASSISFSGLIFSFTPSLSSFLQKLQASFHLHPCPLPSHWFPFIFCEWVIVFGLLFHLKTRFLYLRSKTSTSTTCRICSGVGVAVFKSKPQPELWRPNLLWPGGGLYCFPSPWLETPNLKNCCLNYAQSTKKHQNSNFEPPFLHSHHKVVSVGGLLEVAEETGSCAPYLRGVGGGSRTLLFPGWPRNS